MSLVASDKGTLFFNLFGSRSTGILLASYHSQFRSLSLLLILSDKKVYFDLDHLERSGPTDGGRTDERLRPFIEMRSRI